MSLISGNRISLHTGSYDGELVGFEGSLEEMKSEVNYVTSIGEFIFTAGADGHIFVWDQKSWELIHSLSAHKGAVNYLALHNSGKILFSIGADRRLFTWNLLEGKPVYKKKFKFSLFSYKETEKIFSDLKYERLFVLSDIEIYILDLASSFHYKIYSDDSTINYEKGELKSINIEPLSNNLDQMLVPTLNFKAHDKRIKEMKMICFNKIFYLISISSDGKIKFWDFQYLNSENKIQSETNTLKDLSASCIYEIDLKYRLTCFDVICFGKKSHSTNGKNNELKMKIQQKMGKQTKKIMKFRKFQKIGIS